MNNFVLIAFLLSTTFLSVWKKFGIQDIPDHRSNHKKAIPTAAGICFIVPFIGIEIFNYLSNQSIANNEIIFILGVLALAIIGFIDDWKEINYKIRLVSHIASVCLLLYSFNIEGVQFWLLALIGVALINACNFLDGINGFITCQWLATICFLLISFFPTSSSLWILWASVLAYFPFNFPRARLFMGDTGSTVLGFSYFYVILQTIQMHTKIFPHYIIENDLLVIFCLFPMAFAWFDVGLTLINRLIKKHSLVLSFKDYGFHKLAKLFNSHIIATLTYLTLNISLIYAAHLLFLNHEYFETIVLMYTLMQVIIGYLFVFKLKN